MPRQIYQVKATIVGTRPPVWRRLLVPETTTLLQLHEILQAAFGWWDSHLHEFEINGVRYGTDDGAGWGLLPRVSAGPGWEPSPKRTRRSALPVLFEPG